MITSDTRNRSMPDFEIPSNVLHRMVDGEMVLLNLSDESYFGLNAVGAAIVRRLTAEPFDQAMEKLLVDYEVDPETLRKDIERLVESLEVAGLLKRIDAPE